MALERTLAMVKPNAFKNGHVGEIISAIERGGFMVRGMRLATLDSGLIRGFYAEHLEKKFFPELEAFMSEGPVLLMVLEGEDAIVRWRDLMGATDPAKAAPGTLRKTFGENLTRNAVHGSDSPVSAERETRYFFSAFDLA
ncbi:MAG TPA: nucleoside-diphosphate kinase [Holophaga sp.]|nr:nucleoside-diphosphate kinase [Holophaga sp.]